MGDVGSYALPESHKDVSYLAAVEIMNHRSA